MKELTLYQNRYILLLATAIVLAGSRCLRPEVPVWFGFYEFGFPATFGRYISQTFFERSSTAVRRFFPNNFISIDYLQAPVNVMVVYINLLFWIYMPLLLIHFTKKIKNRGQSFSTAMKELTHGQLICAAILAVIFVFAGSRCPVEPVSNRYFIQSAYEFGMPTTFLIYFDRFALAFSKPAIFHYFLYNPAHAAANVLVAYLQLIFLLYAPLLLVWLAKIKFLGKSN